jgi:hypothetical protein
MAAGRTYPIPFESPLHRKLLLRLSSYIKWAEKAQFDMHEEWRKSEETMMAYIPTSAADNRRNAARETGDPQVTTMVLPYSYAVTMAAHTYFSSVMLARTPVHQFTGRHGEAQNQVNAVEAILSYQVGFGGAVVPYYSWLYDAGRYGFGITKTCWEKQVRQVATLVEEAPPADAVDAQAALLGYSSNPDEPKRSLKIEDVEIYEGNKVVNVSPFDFMQDPRVSLQDFQKGEFCVHVINSLGWNAVLEKKNQGFYMNLERVKTTSGSGQRRTYNGDVSRPRPQDYKFDGFDGPDAPKHPTALELYEVYVHMIPSEFGLGDRDKPELWCFTITQDLSIVIGATPFGYYHCQFPFDMLKIDPDPYTLGARGFPKQLEGVQNTMDWLINTHYYNIRAALQNLFLIDPTRVNLTDLEDPLPGGIIRIRQEAAGQDVRTAIHQIPINDVTKQHLGEIPVMQAIGERIVGVNDSILGAMDNNGRKTATEVRTSTGFGVNRLKTVTEFMSAQGMGPHASKMLQNTQQFYSGQKKFRIAGDTLVEGGKFLMVDRQTIAGFYDFVHIDGALPVDRMAEAKMIQELVMQLASMPQLAMTYDIGRMIAYAMSRAGMKNVYQFRVDVRPDQLIAAQLTAGELEPVMPPRTSASRGQAPSLGNGAGASGPIV